MAGIRRKGLVRTAKLVSLPMGIMVQRATTIGKQIITGAERGQIDDKLIADAAEQVFNVLGELKGGAMKLGQALSVFEAAVPPQFADQYRDALVRLQSQAPPMPLKATHKMLDQQLGTRWRDRFQSFEDDPIAAASIGQVHRAVWADGRPVAVKVQYPGADDALSADLKMLQMFSGAFLAMLPGTDVKGMIDEFIDRTADELDYRIEADYQRKISRALGPDDPQFFAPKVIASAPKVLVSEWMEGTPLSTIIATGTKEQRDSAGMLLAEFVLSSPARIGHLHCDPHPGNFQILPDGRLGVIDFGATLRIASAPAYIGEIARYTLAEDYDSLVAALHTHGFVKPGSSIEVGPIERLVHPLVELIDGDRFHFTRQMLQDHVARATDFKQISINNTLATTAPAEERELAMLARVVSGCVGICAQLDAEGPFISLMQKWLPGFAEAGEAA